MKRDKYFSILLYSICEGLNSFFSSVTQKKICLMIRKKPTLSPILKKDHSQMTLELKPRMGNWLSVDSAGHILDLCCVRLSNTAPYLQKLYKALF